MIRTTRWVTVCACDAQTNYECGGIGMQNCQYTREVPGATVVLCEGRHEIPDAVDGSIFPQDVDPTCPQRLEWQAKTVIRESCAQVLTVYVTGLSVALVAVINACNDLGVSLTLMHYNRATGEYFPQYVRG